MSAVSRVLVTGAGGFVGQEVCGRLVSAGFLVTAVVRHRVLPRGDEFRNVTQRRVVDLMEDVAGPGWFNGVHAVVHLAARVHRLGEHGPDVDRLYARDNAQLTATLAAAAATAGVRRFVFMSSSKALGENSCSGPLRPMEEARPKDAYGRSKLAAEQALLQLSETGRLDPVILRPPLVYGPKVGANFRKLVSSIRRGFPLPFAAIHNQRSLVSVWNLADAVVRACALPALRSRVFHVTDDRAVSTPTLVRLIAEGLGRRPRLFSVPPRLLRVALQLSGRAALGDRLLGDLELDNSDTVVQLGCPQLSIEEGVIRAVREMEW